MALPVEIVAYLALFAAVGFLFLFVNLLLGKLVRPKDLHAEKLEVYECGEPTIGSSFVQFDLRFYVVALLFIIFDVEVALFFPWATVFGKATHLKDANFEVVAAAGELTPDAVQLYRELGVVEPTVANTIGQTGEMAAEPAIKAAATLFAWLSFADVLVFFAVLMAGFLYVWRRGDLDWVRAVGERVEAARRPAAPRALETGQPGELAVHP